jgi:transmembrane sensor
MTTDPPTTEVLAAEWAVRLSGDPLSAEEQQALDHWLLADERHRGALIRARATWIDLDRLAALAAHPKASPPVNPAAPGAPPSPNRRSLLAAGLGALVLAGAGAAGWWVYRRGEVYEVALGESRRISLPDGSSMLLDSSTRAEVHFTKGDRGVDLIRGQGLFEVAKDPARPFIVRSHGVSVRAVGTVFAVRAVDQDVNVTVTEGAVEVADSNLSGTAAIKRVAANERAVVSPQQGIHVQQVTQAQADRHLAWRDGLLSFDGESLADAVAEVNRHSQRQIRIDDPALAAQPVVGIFRSNDAAGFAETVATALGADSTVDGDTLHLHARHSP